MNVLLHTLSAGFFFRRVSTVASSLAVLAAIGVASALSAAEPKSGSEKPTASADVYFLTEAVSVTTSDGIISAPPGTKVTRVGNAPNGMKVKLADGTMLVVTARQVTDDPSKGGAISQEETAKQAAIAAQAQATAAAAKAQSEQNTDAALQGYKSQVAASPGTPPSTSAPGALSGSALDAGAQRSNAVVHHPKKKKK